MYTIQKHLQYNAWASGKLVEILGNVDEKLFDQEVKSSFPTIRKTLLHIWDAEIIWYNRLQGKDASVWPSSTFTGGIKELLEGYAKGSKDLADFIATKDRAFLESSISYTNLKGIQFTNVNEEILFHVVNHGSFHRGQMVTMLRELGFDKFVSQDLITYLRLQ